MTTPTREEVALSPCPWCGPDGHVEMHGSIAWNGRYVICEVCRAQGPVKKSDPEAIAAWNRRSDTQGEEIKRLESVNEALKRQAECWAMEARAHKSSLHEAYQAITDGKGEPGNWNGAEPIIKAFQAAEAERDAALRRVQALEGALETVSAALHNAVLTITLQLSPDHDDAIAGARALGVTESVRRSSRDLSQASSALGRGEP